MAEVTFKIHSRS